MWRARRAIARNDLRGDRFDVGGFRRREQGRRAHPPLLRRCVRFVCSANNIRPAEPDGGDAECLAEGDEE
jgi:hypothetical protein